MNKYEETVKYIEEKIGDIKPKIAIVLGSGLGILAEEITEKILEEIRN